MGGRGALLRRHGRLRDRRHAGRLREAGQPGAGRGLRGRPGACRASTMARTWATTSPTRARSPRRSRGWCWGCRRSPSPSSRARGALDYRFDGGFGFEVAAGFVARLVERIEDVPLPARTLLNVNVPAGEPSGVEVTSLGKRIYRDELKLEREEEHRRRYWIYGSDPGISRRARDRSGRHRGGTGRRDADPLRPHRPPEPRGAPPLRPRAAARTRSRRRRAVSAAAGEASGGGPRARAGAARGARTPRPPLLRARRSGDRRRRVRRAAR